MANMENYESLKNNESIKSDESLQKLIKEINDLKDSNDDKIDNVLKDGESAESPSKILDQGLSKSLMKCDENVLNTLINEVDNLLDSNPNVEGLSDLSKLLKEVKNNREKGNEDSFNKFKDIINKGKLSDLNSLKNEVQNIISFVNDDKNNITTLNLYANMVSLSPDAYKSFKSTDQKVYKDISDAIRNHFNMPEGAGVETAQKIQLEKIFDGMEDGNVKKEDLQKLYEEYVGGEWNEEPIPEDGSVKFNKQVIVSSQDFAKKFNEINGSIPAENNDDVRKGTGELVNEGEEGNGGFEDVDIKEGLAVDEINKYVIDNGGKAIFRKKEQGEGTENKEGGYECNMENVKSFLKKIGNDIKFDKDFVAVKTPSRKAWLSSVQILLNKENEGSLKVDGQYVRGGETYTAVKNFQEKFNKDNNLKQGDEGYLVPDGIPGPLTLGKLLENKQPAGVTETKPVEEPKPAGVTETKPVEEPKPAGVTETKPVEEPKPAGVTETKPVEEPKPAGVTETKPVEEPKPAGVTETKPIEEPKPAGVTEPTEDTDAVELGTPTVEDVDSHGAYTFTNGNEFVGEIKDGKLIRGKLILKENGIVNSVDVERDEKGLKIVSNNLDGMEGKYIDENTGSIILDGNNEESLTGGNMEEGGVIKSGIEGIGKFEGGKFVFDNGVEDTDENGRLFITFNGEKYTKFSDLGIKDGESGKVYQESKDGIYFGEVKGGEYKKSGSGTMLFSNGDTFTGNWENDLPNGKGILTKSDGSKFSGTWENGKFIKKDETLADGSDTGGTDQDLAYNQEKPHPADK